MRASSGTRARPMPEGHSDANLVGRRALLKGGTLAGAGVLGGLGGLSASCSGTATGDAFDPGSWESVRAQFELTRDYAHFSAFMLASHPTPVRNAIAAFRQGLDSDPRQYALGMADIGLSAETRKAVAGYFGAQPTEIALTDSTTMGIALVVQGLKLRAGDEVLTTEHDHYSLHESLRLRAIADGIVVRKVALYDDPAKASVDEIVSRLRAAIRAKTRVAALTWVHSSTGVKLPMKEIGSAVAEINARRDAADRVLVIVDGAHGFAAEDATAGELGCDFFMTGTHKWLFGPRGTGFIWGKSDAWSRLNKIVPPFAPSGFTGRPGPPGEDYTPGGYHSFEHRWALVKAIEFHRAIGKARVAERTISQATRLKEGLAALPNVRLITPRSPTLSAGIICCAVNGMDPETAAHRLFAEHKVSGAATPYRESFLRLGPSIVTTPSEVDRAVKGVAALR